MATRFACLGLALGLAAVSFVAPQPVKAGPAQDYLYGERQFSNFCERPLKYAAGACVPYCPAGFEDLGSYCRLFNQSTPGSRW